jgi:hypothetical protein
MIPMHITREALDAVERAVKPGAPVFMLNLLRFRDRARYAPDFDAPACSGREAFYERYVPGFRRLAAGRTVSRVFIGPVLAPIVAPEGEAWEIGALNEYADFGTFRAIVDTDAYRREVEPHRLAALADFRLLALDRAV